MRNLSWVLTLSGLLVAVLFFTLLGAMFFLPRSLSYGVEAQFDALPENDNEFVAWLKDQPGIVPHTVHEAFRQDPRSWLPSSSQRAGPAALS